MASIRIGDVTTTMLWVQHKISTAGAVFAGCGSLVVGGS